MKLGILLGRLASGLQSDHGVKVHMVTETQTKRPPCPYNDFGKKVIENDNFTQMIALCGAKPGKRSVGWSYDKDLSEITCPRCKKKYDKLADEYVGHIERRL